MEDGHSQDIRKKIVEKSEAITEINLPKIYKKDLRVKVPLGGQHGRIGEKNTPRHI